MTGLEMANKLYDMINEEFEKDSEIYISRDAISVYEKIKTLILVNIAKERKDEES